MKVVCRNDFANLASITSVEVSDADGNVSILVRHQTRTGVKESCIHFLKQIHFFPNRRMTRGFAEEIVADIESLMQHPGMPIESVIALIAWRSGCLGVDLTTATDAEATLALAHLCWDWIVGNRQCPTDKQLEERTQLNTNTIKQIASTDAYKKCVEQLMYNARTAEDFKKWVEAYRDRKTPRHFADRMRLSEEDVETLFSSVGRQLGLIL